MIELNRRQFLGRMLACAAAGASAALVNAACAPRPTRVEESQEQSLSHSGAYLAVARGGEPEEITRQAIRAVGGMGRFVGKGDDVVIKPNICVAYHTFEYAAR